MTGQTRSFRTSDGAQLVYDDFGSGPPVLLVHGFTCQAAHWAFQRQALVAAGYRTIALDLRFHGRSDFPGSGQRVSRLGKDVGELLEHLELGDVALVGHSLGVSVCLAYFDLYGTDRVRAFVAIDQSPKIVNDESWAWGVRSVEWANVWDSVNGRFQWGNPALEPPAPPHVAQLFSEVGGLTQFPDGAVLPLLVDHFTADWRDVAPTVNVPSWVATGRFSPSFPLEGMQWLAENMPKSSLSVFENSGHCPHWNEPEEFNRELLTFLRAAL
ncbi:alpha/beta fold hydrolase [Arthrobacter sp. SAFR-179]|uniref:alpha/beta fold hydrolase n=1 Tax=Arthrobacter sp. SAFR-179 TaxID=3387279 RepID=UPI003F7C9086